MFFVFDGIVLMFLVVLHINRTQAIVLIVNFVALALHRSIGFMAAPGSGDIGGQPRLLHGC